MSKPATNILKSALRPTIDLSRFLELVSEQELSNILSALDSAFQDGFSILGINPFIPSFKIIYSSCFFPYICGYLQKFSSENSDWEVKRTPMTFTLVKKGVLQIHFYKGSRHAALRADSKRKKAILFQEEYASIENLPSIVFQHFSDSINSELLGLHALFYERGKLVESLDVKNSVTIHQRPLEFKVAEEKSQKSRRWKPKPGRGKKSGEADASEDKVA